MLTSINVKFTFDSACLSQVKEIIMVVQFCKYSSKSRCRPSSCLLAVLAVFKFPYFVLAKPVKCSAILYSLPKHLHSQVFNNLAVLLQDLRHQGRGERLDVI